MQMADIRTQWEGAAPGWARWEATVATWMAPATETMLTMAGVDVRARVGERLVYSSSGFLQVRNMNS